MKSIKELTQNKPSQALKAMVEGLGEQSQREDFRVEMYSFGGTELEASGKITCFGCAATCTIQKLANKNIGIDSIGVSSLRADCMGFEPNEMKDFEYAIDSARKGFLRKTFRFYGFCTEEIEPEFLTGGFYLDNYSWKRELQKVEIFIKKLEQAGY